MSTANVSQLKARLSAYLAEVRRGKPVTVLDRETPIARIVPYDEDDERIAEPRHGPSRLRRLRPARLKHAVDLVALLRESRDQR